MPYINSRFIFPLLVIGTLIILELTNKNYLTGLFRVTEDNASLNVSTIIFWVIMLVLSIATFIKNWSLIPLLGLSTCLYLLTGMTGNNWAWFASWLGLGINILFFLRLQEKQVD